MAKKDGGLFVRREATFSPCRRYRYTLTITWDETKPLAAFIGLNPSTADEVQDDPTIRRCRDFAQQWGCGGMVMLNLFAFRATNPEVMKAEEYPIEHDYYANLLTGLVRPIVEHNENLPGSPNGPIVACWGTHGDSHKYHPNFGHWVIRRFAWVYRGTPALQCLGQNADGTPKHPLYLKKTTQLQPLEVV